VDIAALINRLGGTRRDYAGTFYSVPGVTRLRPFRASLELLRTDECVYFEGGVTYDEALAPLAFRLSLPFNRMHPLGSEAELSCTPLGRVEGHFLSCGSGFSFLSSAGVTAVSFHATLENDGSSLRVGGIIRPYPEALAFNAEPATQWERSLRGRVYVLPVRK
jgi:hypothetical protein